MIKTIRNSTVSGKLEAPPSKSMTHRAILCGALAKGKTRIKNPLDCDDTRATINACKQLGIKITGKKNISVKSTGELTASTNPINCSGSGTTLRFFTPMCALASGVSILTGNESLEARPMSELLNALNELGVNCFSIKNNGRSPLIVSGNGINGGTIRLNGNVSSQFISALLLTLPKAEKKSVLELTTKLESRPYVELTLEALERFGVKIGVSHNFTKFFIEPKQKFNSCSFKVPGDFSSASFFLSAGAISGMTEVKGLDLNSSQGDKKIIEILREMNANVKTRKNLVRVEKSELNSLEIDARDIPDLVPVCCVLATQAEGLTRIKNAGRLRLKESDRMASITSELKKMGAKIAIKNNSLQIKGRTTLKGSIIDSHNDHRIAMACSVAGLVADGRTKIQNAECVSKSHPEFFEDLTKIGGRIK